MLMIVEAGAKDDLAFLLYLLSIYCECPNIVPMLDCLELSKIEALKMLDLQTKSTINSDKIQV